MNLPFETKEITQENYYQDTSCLTNSMMGMLEVHPQILKDYLNGKRESNDAFTIGDYLHTSILEPHKMDRFHIINEDDRPNSNVGMTGKDNKIWINELKNKHGEGNVISQKNADLCLAMSEAVLSKTACQEILDGAKYEQIFTSYINGVDTKCMVDIDRTHIDGTVWDIKTTQDSSLEGFKNSFWKYKYFRQAAFYMKHTNATSFGFIVVEKQYNPKVGIYKVSERSLERGVDSYERMIEKYKIEILSPDSESVINNHVMTGEL